jgi:hypothetical protein
MEFNPDIEFRLFVKQDAYDIVYRTEDAHKKDNPYYDSWAEETAKGAGFTGFRKSDGKILGCGGIKVFRPGCGEAWAIYCDEIGLYAKECREYSHYYVTSLMKTMGLHWLQCIIDADRKLNLRFAKSVGFSNPVLLKGYRPDGTDCYMMTYTPEPDIKSLTLNVPSEVFSFMNLRDKVQVIESKIMEQPDALMGHVWPLKHSFAKGLYVRQIKVPAGVLLTGAIHKYSHAFFLLKGDISILTDGGVKRIKAPATFITPAGTKRVVYHHADTIVTTVHSTDKTNVEEIEEELIAKTWEDYDSLPLQLSGVSI